MNVGIKCSKIFLTLSVCFVNLFFCSGAGAQTTGIEETPIGSLEKKLVK